MYKRNNELSMKIRLDLLKINNNIYNYYTGPGPTPGIRAMGGSSGGGVAIPGDPPGSGVGPRGELRSGGDLSGRLTLEATRRAMPRPRAGRLGARRPSLRRGRERSLRRGAPGGPRKGWHRLVEGRSSPPCQGPQPSSPGPSSSDREGRLPCLRACTT